MKSTIPNSLVRRTHIKSVSIFLLSFGLIGTCSMDAKAQAGTFDASFQSGMGLGDGSASCLLILPDDNILVGGFFSSYDASARNNLVKLEANGQIDNSFYTGSGIDQDDAYFINVETISPSGSGGYYVGGSFYTYNGVDRRNIVRIHGDGALDPAFDPGTGFMGIVLDIAVQMGNRPLIAGGFGSYNGQTVRSLCRVMTDGTLDQTFSSNFPTSTDVRSLWVNNNGYIYAGGGFGGFIGEPAPSILKLLPNGGFDPGFENSNTCNGPVYKVMPSGDGNFFLVGDFTEYNGFQVNKVAKVSSQGSLINTYNVGAGPDYFIEDAVVQSDGKLIIVGSFTTFNGVPAPHIVPLLTDGSIDPEFLPGSGSNYNIRACALQSDGKIIIAGTFTDYNGNATNAIARLHNDLNTGIAGTHADSPFSIYPNPASQSCSIVGNRSNMPLNVTLSDVHGRVVRSMTTHKHFDTSELVSGLYVVQITEGANLSTVRLLVD